MPSHDEMVAAVEAYVEAFAQNSADGVVALYASDATVEDPVGSEPVRGRDAIRAFYENAMLTGAKLALAGPVRTVADHAAFAFSVNLRYDGSDKRIDVIDTFRFDDAGRVVEMRAFWGPANMHGFG